MTSYVEVLPNWILKIIKMYYLTANFFKFKYLFRGKYFKTSILFSFPIREYQLSSSKPSFFTEI